MLDFTDLSAWVELESGVEEMTSEAWSRAAQVAWAPERATREELQPLAAERRGHAPVEGLDEDPPPADRVSRYVEYALDAEGAVLASRRVGSSSHVDHLTLRYPLDASSLEGAQLTFLGGFELRLRLVSIPRVEGGLLAGLDLYYDPREGYGTATERVLRDDAGDVCAIEFERVEDGKVEDEYRLAVTRARGAVSEVVRHDARGEHVIYQDAARRKVKKARRRVLGLATQGVLAWATRTKPPAAASCLALVHSFEDFEWPPGLAWGLEDELRDRLHQLGMPDAYRAAEFELYDPLPAELMSDELEREWSVLRQVWSEDAAIEEPSRLFAEVARSVASELAAHGSHNVIVFAVEADYTDLEQSLNEAGRTL